MKPTDPPPVRPRLCDRVHAALIKAGRPVTRGELRYMFLDGPGTHNALMADLQAALDALLVEGLAARGEERVRWQRFVTWRAIGEKG